MRKKNGTIVNCYICSIPTYCNPSRFKKNKFITCSKKCMGLAFSKNCNTKIEVSCAICNKQIKLKKVQFDHVKTKPTCSKKCRGAYMKEQYLGVNNPNYIQGSEIERFFHHKIIDLRSRANKTNIPFNLTSLDLLEIYNRQGGRCFYSGFEMKFVSENYINQPDLDVLSVEKIIPSYGYVKGNVLLCCNSINKMRGNAPFVEFLKFFSKIAKYEITFYE